jgi:hypothetical protein
MRPCPPEPPSPWIAAASSKPARRASPRWPAAFPAPAFRARRIACRSPTACNPATNPATCRRRPAWSGRVDPPARVHFDIATTDSFWDVIRTVFVDALPESDSTAKALIENLPSGQDVLYQVPVWLTHWAASLE